MTDRERILAAIRGEIPDRLPWVPRMEFWYRARVRAGTLPTELRNLSLMELAGRLGMGYYHVVPDFTERANENDMIDRGLGLYDLPVLPYETIMEDVDRRVIRAGQETCVEYHTPAGSITTVAIFTDEMLDGGASVPFISRHALREPRDFDVLAHIFSHLKVKPRLEGYMKRREEVGDRGIVIGFLTGTACPIQHIMKELMPLDQFFCALSDYPEKVEALAEAMQPYYDRIQQCAADSPAEVVLLGGNYDDSITYPRFFEKHILPALRNYAQVLHTKGKYLMTHTDGENKNLLPLYLEADFDVADSVCPYPMTRCHLEEIRKAFADRITIWGGIPSVLLCSDSATTEQFRNFVDDVVRRYSRQSHLILGVSDMVTADADFARLQYITERVTSS